MTLAALFLAAALAPQDPAAVPAPAETPPATEAAPPADAPLPKAASGAAEGYIEAGLKAFRRHRFSAAQADFQKAVEADPQSAAAAFYLGYAYYKIAEPSRRLTAGKKKAAELFARAFELNPAFRPAWGEKG